MNGKFLKIVGIIVFAMIILKGVFSPNNEKTEVLPKRTEPILIFDGKEFYSPWTDNVDSNFIDVQKILAKNSIKGCGEFYINEFEENTFIIACTSDDEHFTYYVAWTKINKFYSTDSSMLKVLLKPNESRSIEKTKLPPHY